MAEQDTKAKRRRGSASQAKPNAQRRPTGRQRHKSVDDLVDPSPGDQEESAGAADYGSPAAKSLDDAETQQEEAKHEGDSLDESSADRELRAYRHVTKKVEEEEPHNQEESDEEKGGWETAMKKFEHDSNSDPDLLKGPEEQAKFSDDAEAGELDAEAGEDELSEGQDDQEDAKEEIKQTDANALDKFLGYQEAAGGPGTPDELEASDGDAKEEHDKEAWKSPSQAEQRES